MPQKKQEEAKTGAEACILKIGRLNNVVQWKEEMQDEACGLYGMTGMFFSTNASYVHPFPRPEEYNPALAPPPVAPGAEEEDDDIGTEDPDDDDEDPLAPAVEPEVYSAALIAKLRANAFEGRRKAIELQKINEQKLWPLMWSRMSTGSKSKVREEPGFEAAKMRLDSVKLWEYIRRSHLTHIYGEDDSMRAVNIHEQTIRYNYLRQGDREVIGDFKTRFDNQVLANKGVGMAEVEESIRAIDFLSKLDPKRYTCMLTVMRNSAVQNLPNSYPSTLAGAYRVASSWTNANGGVPLGAEQHSAFLTDSAMTTKEKVSEKKGRTKTSTPKKKPSAVTCFVCGEVGHYARDCQNRKLGDIALYTGAEEDLDEDERTDESAFVASAEIVLFSQSHVLLDNQASVNVFCNPNLLTDIRRSKHGILLNGVQLKAPGVRVDLEGDFGEVGPVYFSQGSTANILSFAAMVDRGADIKYDQKEGRFTLQPKGSRNIYSFCRQQIPGSNGRFYVCDVRSMVRAVPTQHPAAMALVSTVSANMQRFTKREVASAAKARELLARMGYPPVDMAIAMIRGGNNFGVSENDFRIAHSIWGKCLASLKGKTHKMTSPASDISITPVKVQQEQVLAVDIMYLNNTAVLIGVSTPLDLTLSGSLMRLDLEKPSRAAPIVKGALDEMLCTLKSRNFVVRLIMSDGEGAIGKLTPYLMSLGMEVDVSAAGGHVARIERRIQMVKERARAHICGRLPFTLTDLGNSMLVLYCVSRINCQQSGSRPGGLSPRELFSGRRVDGNLDFRAAFGDYAVCTTPNTDNTMDSRTEDCIVMLPSLNRTGSYKMMSLASGRIVTREHFKILPMPQSVIQTLNTMALREGKKIIRTSVHVFDEMLYGTSVDKSNMPSFITNPPTQDATVGATAVAIDNAIQPQPVIAELPTADGVIEIQPFEVGGEVQALPELSSVESQVETNYPTETPESLSIPQGDVNPPTTTDITPIEPLEAEDTPTVEHVELAQWTVPEPPIERADWDAPIPPRPTHRVIEFFRTGEGAFVASTPTVRRGGPALDNIESVIKRHRMEMTRNDTCNISVKEALRSMGAEARKVIVQELKQMIDKAVWVPVMGSQLTSAQRSAVIRSSMFIKKKNHPDGTFQKLKARLVAGGDQQNKDLYESLSSPTVSTSSVFTMLGVSAHEGRHVAVLDVSGAFLNAEMTLGVPVHMKLDRTMSEFIVGIDKSYSKYVDAGGGIVVLLKKALYGCVESAGLWYENLRYTLSCMGYKRNDYDQCVFNRVGTDGHQCTATVHVDDLLIMSKSRVTINELVEGLRRRYGAITLDRGPLINYLGMSIDLSVSGQAGITMPGYADEIVKVSGVEGTAKSPATDGLFEVRVDSPRVCEGTRVWYHKIVAMILYLAKRTKPECLTAVAFLTTRVDRCTLDDVEKLMRLVKYINLTRLGGVMLRPGKRGLVVQLFVDASYGVHSDGKSHTGSCVVLGSSGAVHCRSSKQLIVTKSSTEAELVGLSDSANQGIYIRSFLIEQGYIMPPLTIYQDNQSCMALIDRGRSGAERTRHIQIRYFWVKERVDLKEVRVCYLPSEEMYANVLTKPLQGAQFIREREGLTGWAIGKQIETEGVHNTFIN